MHSSTISSQAWRGLRNAPAFLALASMVLALGLGATIFTYGVINTTMLKPPPFPDAERLYSVLAAEPDRKDDRYESIPYVDFVEMKQSSAPSRTSPRISAAPSSSAGDDVPERYTGGFVTAELHARARREAHARARLHAGGRCADRGAGGASRV